LEEEEGSLTLLSNLHCSPANQKEEKFGGGRGEETTGNSDSTIFRFLYPQATKAAREGKEKEGVGEKKRKRRQSQSRRRLRTDFRVTPSPTDRRRGKKKNYSMGKKKKGKTGAGKLLRFLSSASPQDKKRKR